MILTRNAIAEEVRHAKGEIRKSARPLRPQFQDWELRTGLGSRGSVQLRIYYRLLRQERGSWLPADHEARSYTTLL